MLVSSEEQKLSRKRTLFWIHFDTNSLVGSVRAEINFPIWRAALEQTFDVNTERAPYEARS